jgi:phosphodiesterase/alkaline phosphatase D-like protein
MDARLMKNFILTHAFVIAAGLMGFADDAVMAAVPTHKAARLIAGPGLESATDTSAIIRWTSINPGRAALHYGVVHYGTDANNLTQVAQSPNRRNTSHPDMIFRVRLTTLNSNTTYYYKVESTGATGASDGASSSVKTFKTP